MPILIFALLTAFEAGSLSTPLWQNTHSEMSLRDLRVAQPGLREAPRYPDGNSRAKCEYTVGNTVLAGREYGTCFHLLEDRLIMVGLYRKERTSSYPELTLVLGKKYGLPVSTSCEGENSWLRRCETIFAADGGVKVSTGEIVGFGSANSWVQYHSKSSAR